MPSLQNTRILITGANSGVGKAASLALAQQGAEIIMACRNHERAETARQEILKQVPNAQLNIMLVDLASLHSIHEFAQACRQQFDRIDILINNAGLVSMKRRETADGFELTMGTNHLGPFLLTHLLLPLLRQSENARIINVASKGHYSGAINFDDFHLQQHYNFLNAYNASKLANVLFTQELAERLKPDGITVNALHPGVVATNIWPRETWWQKPLSWAIKKFMITEEEGAETLVYLASSDKVADVTGQYFDNKKPKEPAKACQDKALQQRLWELSETLTGIKQETDLLIAES